MIMQKAEDFNSSLNSETQRTKETLGGNLNKPP
jgi:hypothetical protein